MIIRGARLIDGTGREPVEDSLVQISDSTIDWVGSRDGFPGSRAEGEQVIDAGGQTLIPGLINCHVHLAYNGETNPQLLSSLRPAEEGFRALQNATNSLLGGVTTVRDCGNRTRAVNALSKEIAKGRFLGPRVLTSGRCVTTVGGHGGWMGVEVEGPGEVRDAVREELEQGADWIKVMATGGVMTPGTDVGAPTFTREELSAAVNEAEQHGARVCAHAIGNEGIKNALVAGVQSIEHGSYLDEEAIDLLKHKDAYHVPTLSAYHQVVTRGAESDMDPDSVAKARGASDSNTESFVRSLNSGVNLAAGTDAGMPFNYHGGIGLELSLMEEAGAQPLEALHIATLGAAKNLGMQDRIGSVEEGKQADLVLLDKDPRDDLSSVSRPHRVFRAGEPVRSVDLPDRRAILMDEGNHL